MVRPMTRDPEVTIEPDFAEIVEELNAAADRLGMPRVRTEDVIALAAFEWEGDESAENVSSHR